MHFNIFLKFSIIQYHIVKVYIDFHILDSHDGGVLPTVAVTQ